MHENVNRDGGGGGFLGGCKQVKCDTNQWWIQGREGQKKFLGDQAPLLSPGLDDCPPPPLPLSEGLDLALLCP